MSLLDGGPDLVTIWPDAQVQDARGNITRGPASGPGISVQCRVQPLSSEESAAAGESVSTMYRVIGRGFPGGAWARINWDGREWDMAGEPLPTNGSDRTRHITFLMRARTPKAAPNG